MNSQIGIPTILKIGSGVLGNIGTYLKSCGLDNVVVYFGNGLIDMFGSQVMKSFEDSGVKVLQYCELDTVDIAFSLDLQTQASATM